MKNTKALSKPMLIAFSVLWLASCSNMQDTGSGGSESSHAISSFFGKEARQVLSVADYKAWVETDENGMVASKQLNEIVFKCQYKPNAYEALLRLRGDSLTKQALERTEKDLEHLQFFTLKIATSGNKGELLKYELPNTDEYYRRIEYCSFNMQNDIKLVDAGDTLNCVLFHFERVFSVAPEATFILGFEDHRPKEEKKKELFGTDKTLCFNDGIFRLGIINLGISKDKLNTIPELDITIN